MTWQCLSVNLRYCRLSSVCFLEHSFRCHDLFLLKLLLYLFDKILALFQLFIHFIYRFFLHEKLKYSWVEIWFGYWFILVWFPLYFLVRVSINKWLIWNKTVWHLEWFELLNSTQKHFDLLNLLFLFDLCILISGVKWFIPILTIFNLAIILTFVELSIFLNVICFLLPVKAQILSFCLFIINATFILAAILKWCCPSMFEYFPSWTCKVRCFIISLSFTWFIWLNFWFHFHFLFRIITNFTSISWVLMLSFALKVCIWIKLSSLITIFDTFRSPFALNVHFMQFSIGISLFDIKFLAINPKLRLWII